MSNSGTGTMAALRALYSALVIGLAIIAGILFVLVTASIGVEAIMRSLGFGFIRGVVDFAEHSIFSIAILAAPWIMLHDKHIRINLLTSHLSPAAARITMIASETIGMVLCAAITFYGYRTLQQSYSRGEYIFSELVIPEWWLQWQVPVAFFLLTVAFALRLISVEIHTPTLKRNSKGT